ncbi:MAG: phosphoglucomutase/phosphomannomutase family protein [Candidatus Firestonebacteria bacterium]|nr:phosphoglucomutase/phosphomannomutase family protein [Candidatus Firestonebacteria bacterium]
MTEAKIKFGTSGWRGIISDDFTFLRVQKAAQAIAKYVKEKEKHIINNGVIVGYDTRFLSEKFAASAAGVLSANGIKVLLTKRDTPTPVISYEIIKRKLAGGINITASHNPSSYNGLKFSPSWGGPALPETTKIIEQYANDPKLELKGENDRKVLSLDPREEYLKVIKEKVDLKLIKKAGLSAGVDLLYGTGREYLDLLLKQNCKKVTVLHNYRDAYFGGGSPEPREERLAELKAAMKKEKLQLGLATDGDADRYGIIDKDGTFITPNEILSLLMVYLKKSRGWNGCVVRTVATTHFVDALAEKYGIPVRETPVGFKYIGEIMMQEPMIIGGEESGGLTIYKHIPEKDGILACLLVLEMVAAEKKSIREILKKLYAEVGYIATGKGSAILSEEKKQKLVKALEKKPPVKFGSYPVERLITMDGFKFLLGGKNWVMIRLSGTEPLVRIYAEADSDKRLAELVKLAKKYIYSF